MSLIIGIMRQFSNISLKFADFLSNSGIFEDEYCQLKCYPLNLANGFSILVVRVCVDIEGGCGCVM